MVFKKLFTTKRKGAFDRGDNNDKALDTSSRRGGRSVSPVSVIAETQNLAGRRIRYSDIITVHKIPSGEEFSEVSWLRHDDFVRIRKRERKLAKKYFLEGSDLGPNEDTFGLQSKQHKESKFMLIDAAIKSVLTEQDKQIQRNKYDPERIAWVYLSTSEESCSLAHERGLSNHYQLMEMNRPHRRRWSIDTVRRADGTTGPYADQRRPSMAM